MSRRVDLGILEDGPAAQIGSIYDVPRAEPLSKYPLPQHVEWPKTFEVTRNTLHVFADGSCHPNPGPGGWGIRLIWNGTIKNVYGGVAGQTNNTMELTAIRRALEHRKRDVPTIIYSDSKYAIYCVSRWWRGWQRNDWYTQSAKLVANRELITAIVPLITPQVAFCWVKGHVGHEHNEAVDFLAGQGRKDFGRLSVEAAAEWTKEVPPPKSKRKNKWRPIR